MDDTKPPVIRRPHDKYLPKTADGFKVCLGMTVCYMNSLDSIAGPHEVVIIRMDKERGWFKDGDQEYSATWDNFCWGAGNARMYRDRKGLGLACSWKMFQ